jgi:hypothetical protein
LNHDAVAPKSAHKVLATSSPAREQASFDISAQKNALNRAHGGRSEVHQELLT